MARWRARHERHDDDGGATALLVIDMLDPYKHPEAERPELGPAENLDPG